MQKPLLLYKSYETVAVCRHIYVNIAVKCTVTALSVPDTVLASSSQTTPGCILRVTMSVPNRHIRCGQLSAGDLLISGWTIPWELAPVLENSSECSLLISTDVSKEQLGLFWGLYVTRCFFWKTHLPVTSVCQVTLSHVTRSWRKYQSTTRS